jgi:hypothetical protein
VNILPELNPIAPTFPDEIELLLDYVGPFWLWKLQQSQEP